jgi:predicted RNase H-like HicB family nuclease
MSEQMQYNIPLYVTIVQLQETTEGDYCYIAFHPELPNVISQAGTAEEAKENLVEATELTIAHLVSNGLPIPEPMSLKSVSSNLPIAEPTSFVSMAHYKSSQESITVPSGQMVTL